MDALIMLTGDHNRVRGIIARFQEAKESEDTTTMQELATKLFEELEVHTTIEEQIFYPTVKGGSDELTELVAEGVEEHGVVDTLMEEIRTLEPGSEEWTAKTTVLIENVEHHADEEESEMFPAVRSAFDATAREELAEKLEAKKRELGAPTTADAIDLTKEELLDKASEQEIPGRSTMSKDELVATVDPR